MKLSDILKQFKTIEPDAQFTQRSKREVLMSPRTERPTTRAIFTFLHAIETSAAVVLAGFFILVLTGSFSGAHSIAPIQYAVIDPAGLHAEAQAIDMQIQLANIDYPQTTSTVGSTIATGTALKIAFVKPITAAALSSTSTVPVVVTSTPSSTLSIDQALEKLSQ